MIEQQLEIYKQEIDRWDRLRTRNMAASGLVNDKLFVNIFVFYIYIRFIVDRRRLLSFLVQTARLEAPRSRLPDGSEESPG